MRGNLPDSMIERENIFNVSEDFFLSCAEKIKYNYIDSDIS